MKHIIKEVSDPDFTFYFDGDMFSSAAGDFGYTLFIVTDERYGYSHDYNSYLNKEDFQEVKDNCRYLFTEVEDLVNGYSAYKNVKEIMNDYNIPYCPKAAHKLKTLTEVYDDFEDPKLITKYLSMKTGKKWETYDSRGCCQGDYAEIIYCPDFYKGKEIEIISDMFWGMGKELRSISTMMKKTILYTDISLQIVNTDRMKTLKPTSAIWKGSKKKKQNCSIYRAVKL